MFFTLNLAPIFIVSAVDGLKECVSAQLSIPKGNHLEKQFACKKWS